MSRTGAGRLAAFGGAMRIVGAARPSLFAGRLAVTVLLGAAPVVAAWVLRGVFDALGAGHRGDLPVLIAALALAGAVQQVLPSVDVYLSAQFARAVEAHTTARLFGAVTAMTGLRRLESPAFQDRLRLAQQAGRSGPSLFFNTGIGIVSAAITLAGFLGTLAVLNPWLAGIVVVAALPGLYAQIAMSRKRAAMLRVTSAAQRRQYFYADLIASHAAAKEVRLFALGPYFQARMLKEMRDIHRAGVRIDRRELAAHAMLGVLGAAVTGGGLWWAVDAAVRGSLTIGDVSVFVAALVTAGSTLALIINNAAMAVQAMLTFQVYWDIVQQSPDMPVPLEPAPCRPLSDGIVFEDVWFRYAEDLPWVLSGLNLRIAAGESVGVVGHNGAGKSTLVKLLCRFYDPDRGRITWDGVDLRDLDVATVRARLSVVFQDFMAYELTAAENIAVGDLDVAGDRDAIEEAGRTAGIHRALTRLPRGYDSLLTEMYLDQADRDDPQTGVLLSGGQWQRLALARSLLRQGRDLCILDEPSSGLDAEAEYEVHHRLKELRRDRATLLISHRLNTVRDADTIVVLSDGVVAERGTHATLIATGGIYARLFGLQARGYGDDAPEPAPQEEAVPAPVLEAVAD